MDFTSLLAEQRDFFGSGATRSVAFRINVLKRLAAAIHAWQAEIINALHDDLHKPVQEVLASEIGLVQSEIAFARRHVRKWAKPQRRKAPRIAWPSRVRLAAEPRGVALILGPWNYPFQLLLSPLVGAIAAGCCAVVKPSELAPRSAEVIATLLADAFEPRHVAVVQGDRSTAQALLAERFDAIFFTGSAAVGREVLAAAAKHLTPVTLELGGKCPCIVCADAPLDVAARRIAWGKLMNAGQTCVAPDHVLVERSARDAFVEAMKAAIGSFYPDGPRQSADFGRIVNGRHFDRLACYLKDGSIALGGEHDVAERYIAPTLLTDVPPDAPVMNEEIFGPILPIVAVENFDAALQYIRNRPTPLAAYLFTGSRENRRRAADIRAGGVCVNDVVVHMTSKTYPFGGLGDSGYGAYHGKASFDVFSHYKPVMHRSTAIDPKFRYPPTGSSPRTLARVFKFLLKH